MRLDAKLSKLEQKAKTTLRCDWCRFSLHDMSPSSQKAKESASADYMQAACSWCGSVYSVNLIGLSENQRTALKIFYMKNDGECYRDERVAAANDWFHASLVVAKWAGGKLEKEFERGEEKAKNQPSYYRQPKQKKKSRHAQAQAEIKDQAYKFLRKMALQEQKLHGPAKHTLHARIEALAHLQLDLLGYAPKPFNHEKMTAKEKAVRTIIYKLSVMQLCEPVIWGKVLPDTAEALLLAEKLAKEFEEERERVKLEREETERQREEERQRQREEYLARTRSQQPAHVPPVPGQPANSAHDDFLRRAMGETAYNAMRKAQGLANNSHATDAQGRRRIETPYISPDQGSMPPPNDGTLRYQQKLAHYRLTGVWPRDE
jgi:hypothetical protein